MKIFSTLILSLFLFANSIPAQVIIVPLIITNGVAIDTLYFGVGPLGTDGIDNVYGEQELPPAPPQEIFDVRFFQELNFPNQIGQGLKKEFRFGIHSIDDTVYYKIKYQLGTGSMLRLTYNFPLFIKVILIDDFSGIVLNDTLEGSGNFTFNSQQLNLGKFNFIVYYTPVLPVELSSFSSSNFDNNIILNWETTRELNNAGFQVQRKKVSDKDWKIVGFVNGAGNTNDRKSYEYYDRNLFPGSYNYRLKQIDFNGNFEYFDLNQIVTISNPEDFYLYQNYPNPFNPATTIKFKTPFDGNITLSVFDINGKLINIILNEYKTAGYYEIYFNAANLSSGVYYYRLESNDIVFTKRFVVVK